MATMYGDRLGKFGGGSGGSGGGNGRSVSALLKGPRKSKGRVLPGPIRFVPVSSVVLLPAASTPAPVMPASMLSLAAAENTSGTGVPVARAAVAGSTQLAASWNRNAALMAVAARAGGGGAYGIITGLTLSGPNPNLLLHVAAGQAMIDLPVEVPQDTTVALTDNIARIWIWLTQNGTLTPVNTDPTPPSAACCLLGSVTTDAGSIRGIDLSGVVYLNGPAWRQTADAGVPGDTPPSGIRMFHRTSGGLYISDGIGYAGPL